MSSERRVLVAALIGWAVVATLALVLGAPLGHDESQYALAARGEVPGGTWLYLSPGTVAVAKLGVLFGDHAFAFHLVASIVGFGIPLATYAVGRAAFDERVGAWATAVIAGAHPFGLRSAELLSDMPAAACVVAGIAVVASELARDDGPRWRFLLVAPAWAAAFYLRYGHAPVIAIAAVVACALWWRRVLARPLVVVAALALFAVLLVPHLVHSIDRTGSALGILELSRNAPAKAYIGQGLVEYVTNNPFRFYGYVVTPVVLCGLAAITIRDRNWRVRVLLWTVAVGQLVAIGLQTRAQPRYVYIAVILLVVLGVDAIVRVVAPRLARAVSLPRALPYVVIAAAWIHVVAAIPPTMAKRSRSIEPIMAAARAVVNDAAGRPCFVATLQLPQLVLATRCDAALARVPYPEWPTDRRIYVVSIRDNVVDLSPIERSIGGTAVMLPVATPGANAWYIDRERR